MLTPTRSLHILEILLSTVVDDAFCSPKISTENHCCESIAIDFSSLKGGELTRVLLLPAAELLAYLSTAILDLSVQCLFVTANMCILPIAVRSEISLLYVVAFFSFIL